MLGGYEGDSPPYILYTYKNNTVSEIEKMDLAGWTSFEYQEHKNYLSIHDGGSDWHCEMMYQYEDMFLSELYNEMEVKDDEGNFSNPFDCEEIAKKLNIEGGNWLLGEWSNTIDEAYTKLIGRNKSQGVSK